MPIPSPRTLSAAALVALALAAPGAALAAPTVIDFDVAPASAIASYSASGVTFTSGNPGGNVNLLTGPNASGNLLGRYTEAYVNDEPGYGTFDPMRADFDSAVGRVSVDLGDYPSALYGEGDDETLFLNVYDANDQFLTGVILGITQFQPTYKTLSVQFAGIKYATFGSYGGFGGSSVYADNFAFDTAVPEPSTWAMLILGFASAGTMIRRRRMLTA